MRKSKKKRTAAVQDDDSDDISEEYVFNMYDLDSDDPKVSIELFDKSLMF